MSNSKRATTPRRTPLVQQVLAYLEQNPDEELTRTDIAAKFDVLPATIDTDLAPAVMGGRLQRERNEDDGIVWRLGSHKTKSPFAPAQAAAKAARRARTQATLAIDLSSIRVEKGVVYQTPPKRSDQWTRLFNDMADIDDSFAVPIAGRGALSHAAAAYRKEVNPSFRFAIKRVSDSEVRIWRKA